MLRLSCVLPLVVTLCLLAGCGGGGGSSTAFGKSTPVLTLSSIAITPSSTSLTVGGAKQLNATATYSDGSTQDVTSVVNWTSGEVGIAVVSNSPNPGVVTGNFAGVTTITATYPSPSLTATATVTVSGGGSTLSAITITPNVSTVAINTQMQLTATGTFSNGNVNITPNVDWTTSGSSTISVNPSGVISALNLGTALITATDPDTGIFSTITLTVTAATLNTITVTPQSPTVTAGTTEQLTALGNFSDGSTQDLTPFVSWSSPNTNVATVNANGVVTGVSAGSIPIKALDVPTQINGTTTVTVVSQ